MFDVIRLKGMEFYAYHGVLEEEKHLGQRFIIDVDIFLQKHIFQNDSLSETVNYAQVYLEVKSCVEKERHQLIETLAEKIASRIITLFDCKRVRVEVHKPNAPIPGIIQDVSVEITREKIK